MSSRIKLYGLLNGLQPVRRLEDLELCALLKLRANELAELRMVLDDEHPQGHMAMSSVPCQANQSGKRKLPNQDPKPRTGFRTSLLCPAYRVQAFDFLL